MTVSVFLPSFNKPGYVSQAVRSVIAQSSPDWELWVLDNSTDTVTRQELISLPEDQRVILRFIDLDTETRHVYDPPVYLCNRYYPQANGDSIIYLSDDDLLAPGLVEAVNSAFNYHPEWEALYFSAMLTAVRSPEDQFTAGLWIPATEPRGSGQVDSQIDGGQIAVRKRVFSRLPQPWYPEELTLGQQSHSDGVLMQKIADSGVTFMPVNYNGVTHRRTPISVYTKA